jgi:membrane fusion protein, heavy metal efflux system
MDGKRSSRALQWSLLVVGGIGWALFGLQRATQVPSVLDGLPKLIGPRAASGKSVSPVALDHAIGIRRDGTRIVVPEGSRYRDRLAVAPVAQKTIQASLSFPASVEADVARTVNILPPVAGRVTGLKIQLGDEVKKGQPLAVIESADLAQAISDAEKAKAQAQLTQAALQRVQGMTKFGGASVKDFEQAQSDSVQAKSELDRANYRLQVIVDRAEVSNDHTLTTIAPIDGTVTTLATAPGSFINDTTQSLMTIANLDAVYITANVPEKDLAFVAKGEAAQVTLLALPGRIFKAKVDTVSKVLDADTRRSKVRMILSNSDGVFKPNMFATVEVFAAPQTKLVVPTSALLINNDTITVFVEVEPWAFERRTVRAEAEVGDSVVVTSGLEEADRIVTRGGVLLND